MRMMGFSNLDNWSFVSLLGDCLSYVCNLWGTESKKISHVVEKEDNYWSNLPPDVLDLIVGKFSYLCEYYRFISVCKSWRDSVSDFKKPCLPPTEYPFLLLAEDVAPGCMIEYDRMIEYDPSQDSDVEDSSEDDDDDDEEEDSSDDDDDEEEGDEEDSSEDDEEDSSDNDDEEEDNDVDVDKKDDIEEHKYDHNKNSVGRRRGLYSLKTGITYYIDLPEAAGRLILGANKGWLVTLGRDLQINLLHPLLNHQISLPPMLTFPQQMSYHAKYMPEDASDVFIRKVAVSSKTLNGNTALDLDHHHPSPSPTVMAIYGDCYFLGFARLGNKVWTDVNVSARVFDDIVYHKGSFYAVDCHGNIFVCGINDEGVYDIRGRKIASLESEDCDQKYLVESTSGSGLLLLVRYRKHTRFNIF